MVFLILAGLLAAFASPLLYRFLGKWIFIPMSLIPLLIFSYLCSFLPQILNGKVIESIVKWAPTLNIELHFYLDGLSFFFALLITGFGTLIMFYAGGYLKGNPQLGRFYLYLMLFMTAMLGVVLAGNIFCLFVFWELTSLSSYLLIGFQHQEETTRTSALQGLLVTGGGGLALMAGLILLGLAGNSFSIPEILNQPNAITSSAYYLPALVLIFIGAFTKSAQFPFHFWLPNAMAAPTPVSAYLHSATMVKAGIYLLARLTPALGGTPEWQNTLMLIGGITATIGAFLAIQQTDLKAILAYTTISALGILVMLTGIGTSLALQAMLVFLLAHALYKGTLFLVAGNVDHATGTRDITALGGLGKPMRFTGIAALLAALSMAGILPFFGFIGKELLYETTLASVNYKTILFGIAFFSGMVFVAVALAFGFGLFLKKHPQQTAIHHRDSLALYLPPLILSLAGLAFGLLPGFLATPLLIQAAGAMQKTVPFFELKLWHGFTPVLGLSLLTLFLGYFLYRFSGWGRQLAIFFSPVYKIGPAGIYQFLLSNFLPAATAVTAFIQNGYLRSYIATIILTLVFLTVLTLTVHGPDLQLYERLPLLLDVRMHELALVMLVLPALVFLFITRSRLTSIAILGMVGYAIALIYILFGAPDVAATQLLIETLTVVLFVLILHKLPAFKQTTPRPYQLKYLVVSILFGSVITYVLLLVKQFPLNSDLKTYFGENSYVLGKGRNIVNVILVDFRALDTLGEIVVLAVAAMGIYAMLKMKPEKGKKT
ncbi:putative monovalent cation/H+ antiporter subunit A [Adhaeribacter terreus]|uniref:Monovalent cation/H+ antiporter subunit A n=1 Tax=Adhaeribacter terreus TaxID=529703 RepID=A0ABW0EG09_9BACT